MLIIKKNLLKEKKYILINYTSIKVIFTKINYTSIKKKFLKTNKKHILWGFPGGSVVENLPADAGDQGSIPGPGRSHMPRSN